MSDALTTLNNTIRSVDPALADLNENLYYFKNKRNSTLEKLDSAIKHSQLAETIWKRLVNPVDGASTVAYRLNSTMATMPVTDVVFNVSNGPLVPNTVHKLVQQQLVSG